MFKISIKFIQTLTQILSHFTTEIVACCHDIRIILTLLCNSFDPKEIIKICHPILINLDASYRIFNQSSSANILSVSKVTKKAAKSNLISKMEIHFIPLGPLWQEIFISQAFIFS